MEAHHFRIRPSQAVSTDTRKKVLLINMAVMHMCTYLEKIAMGLRNKEFNYHGLTMYQFP